MTKIVVDFSVNALSALRLSPKDFTTKLKIAAVVQWYAERRISQSKACEILDINRTNFLNELFKRKIPAIQLTTEELNMELEAGSRLNRALVETALMQVGE